MTKLGEYLSSRSANKATIARKTGLSKQRMGELTLNDDAKLRAHETYLIALALGVRPAELFEYVCAGLELKDTNAQPAARKNGDRRAIIANGVHLLRRSRITSREIHDRKCQSMFQICEWFKLKNKKITLNLDNFSRCPGAHCYP